MSKKKIIIKAFLTVSCCFFLAVLSNAESCSIVGQMQFKPDGTCDTLVRTCCERTSGGKWGDWGTGECVNTPCSSTCPDGYVRDTSVVNQEDGDCCKKSSVNAVVNIASAIVFCSDKGEKSYEVCSSYLKEKEFPNLDDYDTACSYDSCSGATNSYVVKGITLKNLSKVYTYSCKNSVTAVLCPSSMSDEDICNAYGKGYKCIKSVTGSCGQNYDLYSCGNDFCYDDDDIRDNCGSTTIVNYDSECRETPLFEETVYVNALGEASYLSCE